MFIFLGFTRNCFYTENNSSKTGKKIQKDVIVLHEGELLS